MAVGQAVIIRITGGTGGPFMYTWDDDVNSPGIYQTASGIATLGAAIDAIKPLAAALPGTIQRVEITVVSQ